MKRIIKRTIIVSSIALVVSFGFIFGTCLFDFYNVRRTYLPFESLETGIEESEASDILFEQKASDVAIVDVVAAIADNNGFSILNEKTGEETQITSDPASSVVFDGQTAYFIRTGIKDPSVVVRSGGGSDDVVEYVGGERHFWERCRVCLYDVSTNQVKELFDTNGYNSTVIYADEKSLYFTDYAGENVGWFVGASQYVAPTLFRYDFQSKEIRVIADYASKIGMVGNVIVYTDSKASSYRHRTRFYGGTLHFYDTYSQIDYSIAGDSEFLYAENNTYFFVTVQGYSSSQDTPAAHPVTYVKCCKLNGGNVSEIKHFDGAWEHHLGQYIGFISGIDTVTYRYYNALTDETMFSHFFDYAPNSGQAISLDYSNPGLVWMVTENGEFELLYDVSDQLPEGYAVTSIFDENGIYCSSRSDSGIEYKFIPFEKGLGKATTSSMSAEIVTIQPGITQPPMTQKMESTTSDALQTETTAAAEQLYRPPQEYFCSQYTAFVFCTDTSIQDYVKMRNGPSTQQYGICKEIPNFEKVTVESTDCDGWTLCYYDGTEGWIKSRFLFSENEIEQYKS